MQECTQNSCSKDCSFMILYNTRLEKIIIHSYTHTLTLYNSTLAQKIRGWTCGEEVSCADHNIIFFWNWFMGKCKRTKQYNTKRYIMKAEKWEPFTHNLAKNLIEKSDYPEDIRDWTARDNEISQKIKTAPRYWPSNTKIYFSNNGCLWYDLPGN